VTDWRAQAHKTAQDLNDLNRKYLELVDAHKSAIAVLRDFDEWSRKNDILLRIQKWAETGPQLPELIHGTDTVLAREDE
jgi:hypothetical protein